MIFFFLVLYDMGMLVGFVLIYFLFVIWIYGLFVFSGFFVFCIFIGVVWGCFWGVVLRKLFLKGNWGYMGSYVFIGVVVIFGNSISEKYFFFIIYKI